MRAHVGIRCTVMDDGATSTLPILPDDPQALKAICEALMRERDRRRSIERTAYSSPVPPAAASPPSCRASRAHAVATT